MKIILKESQLETISEKYKPVLFKYWKLVGPSLTRETYKLMGVDLLHSYKLHPYFLEYLVEWFGGEEKFIERIKQNEGKTYHIEPSDVMISRETHPGIVADTYDNMTIVLDTELNEDLIVEGLAREIINKINTMRRDMGLEITDRINLTIETTHEVKHAFMTFKDYICHETLTKEVHFEKTEGTEWDLNGHKAVILLTCLA
jgi:hypothetical protein